MGSGTYYGCPTIILVRRQELSTAGCWVHNQVTEDNEGARTQGSESRVQCPAWVFMPIVSVLRRLSPGNCYEFKGILRYIVTSKPVGVARMRFCLEEAEQVRSECLLLT